MFNITAFQKTKMISEHTMAAKAIKTELAEKYPGIAFLIKSKLFANGNNVTVDWTGGPTSDAIEAIVAKYRYGTFDASKNLYMKDSPNSEIPQAQYVMISHHYSDSSLKKAKAEIAKAYNVDMDDTKAVFAVFGIWPQTLIRAKLEQRSPFNAVEIE